MRRLTVLYDPDCALCQRAWIWLNAQRQYVRLEFIPAGSELVRSRFPGLDPETTLRELTVVGDGGEIYLGVKAWLICLWALRDYRAMALRWSAPGRMELARRFVAWISRNRGTLSSVLPPGRSR
ncbi:MAG: thiol-disulfide oxidoreductase DCC family protein [Thermoanaerobaculia bacterium]